MGCKRYYLFAVVLLLFAACSKEIPLPEENPSVVTKNDVKESCNNKYEVSIEALKVFLFRTFTTKTVERIEVLKHKDCPYLYNVQFSEGWAIISADKRCNPIIAKAEDGIIPMVDTPGVGVYLEMLQERMQHLVFVEEVTDSTYLKFWEGLLTPERVLFKKTVLPEEEVETKGYQNSWWVLERIAELNSTTVSDPSIEHLMQTKWGQSAPWNFNVPYDYSLFGGVSSEKCVTGCGPVAIAQVLYYWHNKAGVPAYYKNETLCFTC